MPHILAIDLGTSSVKAALLDADTLRVVATAAEESLVQQPLPNTAEQAPQEWWRAAQKAVRRMLKEVTSPDVRAIGLAGQMHGVVCLDAEHKPLRPAIIWADARSRQQTRRLIAEEEISGHVSGAPGQPATGFMASSLMWIAENEPDVLQKTQTVLLPKDYLRLMLTGTIGTDISDAASTWLFDVRAGDWSDELIARCKLERRYLPSVRPSTEIAGELTPEAAQKLGLKAGLPVITGSADLPAQALGYGLTEPGTALIIVGTGGQVFTPLQEPQLDPDGRYYVFNHNVPDRWYAQAAMLSAGLSLRWLREIVGLGARPDAYDTLSAIAADVPPGADNLLFLPYLAGERAPHMDAAASGVFFGLRLNHGVANMARAVMEGVTFALADCLDLVGEGSEKVLLSGGAASSTVWGQMMANVFDRPLWAAADAPHACIGAGILAGVGVGLYPSIADAVQRLPEASRQINPQAKQVALYSERREQYRRLYPLLKQEMHMLAGEG